MRPWNANAQSPHVITQTRNIIGHRDIGAANVKRIVTRNSLQHHRSIADASSQRPNMIERPRKRNHAARGNPPISRLDPHAPAKRSGFANGSCRIGPNRRIAKSRSNRRRRSSRRSAGNMLFVPGIVNVAEKADQRTAAISELMQIVLAQYHCACPPQSPHDFSVLSRYVVLQKPAGSGCPRARGIHQVFQSNRNPVQWPTPLSTRDFDLGSPSLRQRRLGGHRNEGIQRGVEFLNAIQASASHLDRRNFFPPQTRGKLNDIFQNRHRRRWSSL